MPIVVDSGPADAARRNGVEDYHLLDVHHTLKWVTFGRLVGRGTGSIEEDTGNMITCLFHHIPHNF